MNEIEIVGARIHNLKNINVNIPKNKLVAITGVSGSGKSSLAFDIIFQEGMRRYLQSIGFPPKVEKEKPFTSIKGLAPTVAVEQRTIRLANPRSTVGTKSIIYSMLRQLYALEGKQNCPICKVPVNTNLICDDCGMKVEKLEIKHFSFNEPSGMCMECQGRGYQMDYEEKKLIPDSNWSILKILKAATGAFADLKNFAIGLAEAMNFDINTPFNQLPENIQDIFLYGTDETVKMKWKSRRFEGIIEAKFEGVIPHLARAMEKSVSAYRRNIIEQKYMTKVTCKACDGYRINEQARNVFIEGKHIGELASLTIDELIECIEKLNPKDLKTSEGRSIQSETLKRLKKFSLVGLSYLSLNRRIPTLSGGEIQRLSFMDYLDLELNGLVYVLDEPTLGMHQLEKKNLELILNELKELGNSVIIVEHDKSIIEIADHIIDIGPGPGIEGGEIVFEGKIEEIKRKKTLTGQYLAGTLEFPKKTANQRRKVTKSTPLFVLSDVQTNNLKNIRVEIPLGMIVGIAGVSGSGKSSLISDTLVPLLKEHFSKRATSENEEDIEEEDLQFNHIKGALSGWEEISNCVVVTQSPIGRTKTSNPISYIGIWENIRKLFANQPLAKKRKYTTGHFSFNSDKGRCPKCKGEGIIDLQISFLSSVDLPCEECDGTGYLPEILDVKYKEKTIHEILNLTVREAIEIFSEEETIIRYLKILDDIGMGYITLGQSATTLSGGEAQRIKLAKELGKSKKKGTIYILDEPTTGLHASDVSKLLIILDQLVEQGNTVIIIEHDLDVLQYMDWIIELGPEGGPKGGEIIATGPPEAIMSEKKSKTGPFLKITN
ncbi:MAG TPA: excinuclease ABC subunit UvrA [Candidatus Deferrimicrobium sp.]|nr:excinuclease ABC subunit UvrA [Candidatus Deferrimicrobium sp.]